MGVNTSRIISDNNHKIPEIKSINEDLLIEQVTKQKILKSIKKKNQEDRARTARVDYNAKQIPNQANVTLKIYRIQLFKKSL